MLGKRGNPAGDEISVTRLIVGLVVLVAGALVLDAVPILHAIARIGSAGTVILILGILALSVAFFRAYERLTPSTPPTPRRDLAVIVFAASLIGLWTFVVTNEVVAVLVLTAFGVFLLFPEGWQEWLADRMPHRGLTKG